LHEKGALIVTDVLPAALLFLGLCIAWIAIGRRRTVRIVRVQRDEQAA
jgi:hypothetical protein